MSENKIKPVSPEDVQNSFKVPDFVINAVNKLLKKKWYPGATNIVLNQCDVIEAIKADYNTTKREIYDKHWLDFEDDFRAAGWDVKYVRGEYWETFDPYFVFKPKENK